MPHRRHVEHGGRRHGPRWSRTYGPRGGGFDDAEHGRSERFGEEPFGEEGAPERWAGRGAGPPPDSRRRARGVPQWSGPGPGWNRDIEPRWGGNREGEPEPRRPARGGRERDDDPYGHDWRGEPAQPGGWEGPYAAGYGGGRDADAWGFGGEGVQQDWSAHGMGLDVRRGPYAGRGPKGYRRSDDRIREDVCERLTADPDVDASRMTVEVRDGEVTLEGEIDDRAMKRAAEDCSERVAGVREVHNRLLVRPREDGPARA